MTVLAQALHYVAAALLAGALVLWVYLFAGQARCWPWRFVSDLLAAAGCGLNCVAFGLDHDPFSGVLAGVYAARALLEWRRRPPSNRRKVREVLGAKARAARERLVAAMPKPRPAPAPA